MIREIAPHAIAIFHELSAEDLRIIYTITTVIAKATIITIIVLLPISPDRIEWNSLAASTTPSLPKVAALDEK